MLRLSHRSNIAIRRKDAPCWHFRRSFYTLCLLYLSCIPAQAQYTTRITQVDTKGFPRIRVYVSIADSAGNPIPDTKAVTLNLYEDERLVSSNVLSQGQEVYSILVLDVSHSMLEDEKLTKAKAAAISYVNMAPPNFSIAVVAFASGVWVASDFTNNKRLLQSRIDSLSTMGQTALQDGIGKALDLLHGKRGRKVITTLTDGWENHSQFYIGDVGKKRLIDRGLKEECTISTIGLGSNVEADYLKSYEKTGGIYLFSPGSNQLKDVFGKAVTLLARERIIEYATTSSDPDGTRGRLTARLSVGDVVVNASPRDYVKPGLLPHVPGNHLPFILVVSLLLLVPGSYRLGISLVEVYRFRARYVKRLQVGSQHLNRRDLNLSPGEKNFQVGDLVVICPVSNTPYHVRFWRLNKCNCMREPRCKGSVCYHRILPRWVRYRLDSFSKEHEGEAGRTWLCRCAGDKAGC
jgi:von Willebrand factor type A domain